MSFFKKVLSSVGIGSAKIDTILLQDEYRPGDDMDVEIHINGGKVEQDITGLYFKLSTKYTKVIEVDTDDGEEEVDTQRTAYIYKHEFKENFILQPNEKKVIPLKLTIPHYCPVNLSHATRVNLSSGLDIKAGLDSKDLDEVDVLPGELLSGLLDSLEELGFELHEAENIEFKHNRYNPLPMAQELEFKPRSGPYRSKLDEIEIIPFVSEDRLDVIMEVDRKARGFVGFLAEALDMDETKIKFTITHDDLDNLTETLEEMIDDQLD